MGKGRIAAFQDTGREVFVGSSTSWWPQFFVSRALLVLPYRGWGPVLYTVIVVVSLFSFFPPPWKIGRLSFDLIDNVFFFLGASVA